MLSELKLDHGFWYLATVYTKHPNGVHDAARVAGKLAGRLTQRGVPVFSPICHSHLIALAAHLNPVDHDFWMAADRPMMVAARGLIVATMEGWTQSRGITEEIAEFNKAGKPIWMIDPLTPDLESMA